MNRFLTGNFAKLVNEAIESDITREELADALLECAVIVMRDCTTYKDISQMEWLRNQLEGRIFSTGPRPYKSNQNKGEE